MPGSWKCPRIVTCGRGPFKSCQFLDPAEGKPGQLQDHSDFTLCTLNRGALYTTTMTIPFLVEVHAKSSLVMCSFIPGLEDTFFGELMYRTCMYRNDVELYLELHFMSKHELLNLSYHRKSVISPHGHLGPQTAYQSQANASPMFPRSPLVVLSCPPSQLVRCAPSGIHVR